MTSSTAFPSDPIAYFASARPNKVACYDVSSGVQHTYQALNARIERLADMLWRVSGPHGPQGRRVATLARNSAEMIALYFACLRVGAIFAPLNWRLGAGELTSIAQCIEPDVLFCDAEFEAGAAGVSAGTGNVIVVTDADVARLTSSEPERRQRYARAPGEVSTLLCTSGTTGKPKAVMLSEANARATARNYATCAEVGPHSVLLCNMPLFHVVGLFALVRTAMEAGASVVLASRFDAAETVAHIANSAFSVTHYFCAPQMAQMLREAPNFNPAHFRRLTALQTGGAPNPASAVRTWLRDGIPMVDGFGMSEAGTLLGMPTGDLDLLIRKAGAAGLPAIDVALRLVDRDGNDVGEGEAGELWFRGPSVTQGYWRNEEATRAAFHDGWFKSGDAARRDADGFYSIVDRWKDMYVSGGENVYPAEVEAVLATCAGVAEIAVTGAPDARWGEVGVAFVVRTGGASLTEDQVIAHCRGALAAYKAPKHVVFVEALPRTASGKVQKNLLRWTGASGDRA